MPLPKAVKSKEKEADNKSSERSNEQLDLTDLRYRIDWHCAINSEKSEVVLGLVGVQTWDDTRRTP